MVVRDAIASQCQVACRHQIGGTGGEFYSRAVHKAIFLRGEWIKQAGFTDGMPVKIRVMSDCIVITSQNSRELWGCTEGLSVVPVNRRKVTQWLKAFPGALNDTGDLPVIKRGDGHFA